jgi:uncharacterized cupin superfamily protein
MEIGNASQKELMKMGVEGEARVAETERKHYPIL